MINTFDIWVIIDGLALSRPRKSIAGPYTNKENKKRRREDK